MNRLRNLVLLVCLMALNCVWAATVSEGQAMDIAARFLSSRSHLPLVPQMAFKASAPGLSAAGKAAYYVFNAPTSGFVIVAGDDRAPQVLGYSDTGTFNRQDIPEAMQALLDSYAEQMAELTGDNMVASHMAAQPAITPLVPCAWSQNNPYNILFPYISSGKHAYVGCVATAMAQMLYYHHWPLATTDTIPAYTSSALSIEMPALPIVEFDWASMQDTYSTTDTLSQAALAASQLSLYCAQAVEMNFQTSSSGAVTARASMALSNYFGYSKAMQMLTRESYTTQEWEEIIYSELAARRPVIYAGNKASSGHAFICDGYDGDGKFHINWGWNGQSNGYFVLNVLNPDLQGTGSASGSYGYIYTQRVIIGIEPDYGADNTFALTSTDLSLNSFVATRESSDTTFQAVVSAHFNNYTSQLMTTDLGWGLFQNDVLVTKIISSHTTDLKPGSYINHVKKVLNFGQGLEDGVYYIKQMYSVRKANDWHPCLGTDKNYIEVVISGNTCTFTGYGVAGDTDYTVNDVAVTGTLHPTKTNTVTLNMTNNGTSSNQLLYMFVDGTFMATGYVSLEQGETGDVPFSFIASAAGTYALTFSFNEDGSDPIVTRSVTITGMDAASLSATLKILDETDATNRIITSDKYAVVLTITNKGTTAYNEDITMKMFKNTQGNSGTTVQVVNKHLYLEPGDTAVMQFDMDNVVNGWKYFLKSYYYSSGTLTALVNASMHTIIFPEAPDYLLGDVNGNGEVSIADVTALIDYLLGNMPDPFVVEAADVNQDGEINIGDVTTLIDYLLGN